jgi:hypothetical protein
MINSILSALKLMYLMTARPFNSMSINFIEIFNEFLLLLGAGLLTEFTDYDNDKLRKYNTGFTMVILMTTAIVVNTLFFIADLLSPLF